MHRVKRALRLPQMLQHALFKALEHDALNLAQSAAYSAMVALFPALIVTAAAVALLPDAVPLKAQVGDFFEQVLPASVLPLLTSYFVSSPDSPHTARTLLVAAIVSLTGASSVLATLMEGLRRAEDLPNDAWSFGQRRTRAFLLVPLSLVPLAIATMLVVFGQLITEWMAAYLASSVRPAFYAFALAVRWTVSLAGVTGLTASIYHFGTPNQAASLRDLGVLPQAGWLRMLPGAIMATATWFVSTLVFGWYVTRFANYNQVYGSLGAGIALLFWLYIVFFSVLCGAEFNAQFHPRVDPATHETLCELPSPGAPNPVG